MLQGPIESWKLFKRWNNLSQLSICSWKNLKNLNKLLGILKTNTINCLGMKFKRRSRRKKKERKRFLSRNWSISFSSLLLMTPSWELCYFLIPTPSSNFQPLLKDSKKSVFLKLNQITTNNYARNCSVWRTQNYQVFADSLQSRSMWLPDLYSSDQTQEMQS